VKKSLGLRALDRLINRSGAFCFATLCHVEYNAAWHNHPRLISSASSPIQSSVFLPRQRRHTSRLRRL